MLGVVNAVDLLGISSLLVTSENLKEDTFSATEHLFNSIKEMRKCFGRPRCGIKRTIFIIIFIGVGKQLNLVSWKKLYLLEKRSTVL